MPAQKTIGRPDVLNLEIDNQTIWEENMIKKRNTTIVVIAVVLATIWTIAGASRAQAVIAIIRQTGVFSLTQGQATSAHVVNIAEERGIVIDWRVLDSAGNVLAQSNRRRVGLGQASSFDFGPLALREGERVAIRLELVVEGVSRNKPAFIATQEVFNTGDSKTVVFLPYLEQ
jgi:ABC-type taurine transport system substrate-binding protein